MEDILLKEFIEQFIGKAWLESFRRIKCVIVLRDLTKFNIFDRVQGK